MMRIEVEGGGTIANSTSWSSTARLNAGGSFSFSMPASDPAAALIVPLAVVSCYVDNVLEAMGIVNDIAVAGDQLTASGEDMSRELALRTVQVNIANATAAVVVSYVGSLLPAGWTFVNQVSAITFNLQLKVLRDSLLNLIATVCEMGGFWFTFDGRTLTISETANAVVEGPVVVGLRQATAASDVVNKVYVYGSGDGSAALTLQGATATVPAGYALDLAASSITHTASPYPLREKRLDLKQIGPLANTDLGVLNAKNALVIAGHQALKSMIAPVVTYDATVLWTGRLLPLQRLRLTHKSDALAVDATLVITEVTVRATAEGVVTSAVTLQADGRRVPGDAEVVAGAIRAARIGVTYPQLSVSEDTLVLSAKTSREGFDLYNGPAYTFRFGAEVAQVQAVIVALTAVGLPELDSTDLAGRVPPAFNYRINGSSWATFDQGTNGYSNPVDITSSLINSQTQRPLQTVNTFQLQPVYYPDFNWYPTQNVTVTSIAGPPVGIKVKSQRVSAVGQFYTFRNPSTFAYVGSVPYGKWLQVTSSTLVRQSLTIDGDPGTYWIYYVQMTSGSISGAVPIWLVKEVSAGNYQYVNTSPIFGDNYQSVEWMGWDALVTAQFTLRNVVQPAS